ncbi:hypothetical protein ISN44_As08g030790 [Arabidopsis suecica]|uniref:Uncharacterized protein n=1 Tax=Arabidopsis suecica TaxID=45249 RepID=A0A8T2B8W2_ARASU|nr:hypothetical protein ISN44_As08g030790 [Arabidopsis suecica]
MLSLADATTPRAPLILPLLTLIPPDLHVSKLWRKTQSDVMRFYRGLGADLSRRRYMRKTGPCETWWTQEAPKDISFGKGGI